jgi:hypothetical protein
MSKFIIAAGGIILVSTLLVLVLRTTPGSVSHGHQPQGKEPMCESQGRAYSVGDYWPAGDGCNTCSCVDFTGPPLVLCTAMLCGGDRRELVPLPEREKGPPPPPLG